MELLKLSFRSVCRQAYGNVDIKLSAMGLMDKYTNSILAAYELHTISAGHPIFKF
ncbi:hypothetical protein AGMMS49574_05150 [Bacteroidia bacterium]|nr:hypothetical protein AGMMS49574_05150 [Bacteroidia bacterium]